MKMKKEKMPWLVSKVKPPFIALSVLLLMLIVNKVHPSEAYFRSSLAGTAVFIIGLSLIIWSVSLFKNAKTKLPPKEEPTALVIRGPFLYTRNPMYLGMTLMLVGASIMVGTLASLLGPVLFLAIINTVFVPYEEIKMRRIFGKGYVAYTKKVRRWV